jgi:hypothetical protein
MDGETTRAIIATVGAIIVALVGSIGARIFISRAPRAAAATDGEAPVVPSTPLERFSGTENEFVKIVIEDSRHRAKELAEFRAESDGKHEALRLEIDGLRADLGAKVLHQNAFERAIKHYLAIVVNVVQALGGEMPQPELEDRELLDPILPNRIRTTKSPQKEATP